ncbi:MAG: hypothetical protein NXI15_11090 [Gammaproteobacteria bacterium]|nr:hypothetical protein [Gammaproteobacteria bacterium]
MARSIFDRINSVLWTGLVGVLCLLALYVGLGRLLVMGLGAYDEAILQEINLRVPFDVQAADVSGQWRSFTPEIVLSELRISLPEDPQSPLELTRGQVGIDVWNSLRSGSLQVTHLIVDGLNLRGEFTADGKFGLRGFSRGQGESGQWLQEFLLNISLIQLRNNALSLALPGGEVRDFDLNLELTRSGSFRRSQASLTSTRGTRIVMLARGVGNPLQPKSFTGTAYVDVFSRDLGAMQDLFGANAPALWADGELELEFWLSFDAGKPEIATRIEATNLQVAPREGDWSLPLSRIALEAHVLEAGDRWRLQAADVEVANGDHAIVLPRLQLDAWETALRLRAADLDIATLARFAGSFEVAPQGFNAVLQQLAPAGSISALQLNIADYRDPLADWELESNFSDVFVAPYAGAPGGTAVTGFMGLRPGSAEIILDSQALQLDFPNIYPAPLTFDELFGTLLLSWDEQRFTLSSGLLSASSVEGPLTALLGLDIPLQPDDVGIEMDLLVGVRDAELAYLEKYLPYTLDEGLLDWLQGSLGEGQVEAGSFLWRGSLQSDASALRTVQLAFNVADTPFPFHPDWPAVTVGQGIVLVDNAAVSVWVDSGTLLESSIARLSVETGLDAQSAVLLAIDGELNGPVADALHVVNTSPLADIVGDVFAQWEASGELQTALRIDLSLAANAPPPRVDVTTTWRDADLTINPGNIPLRDVAGQFMYSSQSGFASRDLVAQLWGQRVDIALSQQHGSARGRYEPDSSTLVIGARSRLAMSQLRQWLDLDLLSMATGETAVDLSIQVTPGKTPQLFARSDLRGVSLDLPQPWAKSARQVGQLQLSYDLDPAGQLLFLDLDDDLALNLRLQQGALVAGGLGIGGSVADLEEGKFTLHGQVPYVEASGWMAFLSEHFAGFADGPAGGAATPVDAAEAASAESAPALEVVVDNLQIAALEILGDTYADVTTSLTLREGDISGSIATDWLRGDVFWSPASDASRIDVHLLDIDGLAMPQASNPEPAAGAEGESQAEPAPEPATANGQDEDFIFELPPVSVSIADIYRQGRRLGHLDFALEGGSQYLLLSGIAGDIAGMRFAQDQPAWLRWDRTGDARSSVAARLVFDDLGDTLEQFGYQKIIQTRKGAFTMDLSWPGAPSEFALAAGSGSLLIDLGKGSFLDVPAGAAGALRVVSILNLVHIVQSLSVTHMFDSGIPFDKVKGEVYLHEGTLEVPRINVAGGSSFVFSGVSDIGSESLNGELVATLPVAKNLPWVAALAAGLPVAAGVFVVSQLFDKQVSRLTSAVYSIEGTWNEPRVSFSRIFDNTQPAAGAAASELPPATVVQELLEDPNAPGPAASAPAIAVPDD